MITETLAPGFTHHMIIDQSSEGEDKGFTLQKFSLTGDQLVSREGRCDIRVGEIQRSKWGKYKDQSWGNTKNQAFNVLWRRI